MKIPLKTFDTRQEKAAATLGVNGWQTFWRVTFPSSRWGLIYGVTLTFARSLGEFRAVLVVGGSVQGSVMNTSLFIYHVLEERRYIATYRNFERLGVTPWDMPAASLTWGFVMHKMNIGQKR